MVDSQIRGRRVGNDPAGGDRSEDSPVLQSVTVSFRGAVFAGKAVQSEPGKLAKAQAA
jgi:hypothetical protein